MTLIVGLDGSPLPTNAYRSRVYGAPGPSFTSAADGTGSQGSILFDDPTGTRVVRGWSVVTADEDDCPNSRLYTGCTYNRTERRGSYRHGAGREIDVTLNDQNVFLAMRNMGGADCVRPAETDIQRLAWLTSSPYLDGLVADTGWVNGTGLPFPATSYKGKFATDVLSDLAGPYGQIYFAAYDHNNSQVGLFFDFPDAVVNTSSLTISNVRSDVDFDVCFPPMTDGSQDFDPQDVISHVRYVYANGVYYANNAGTAAAFFPDPLISRGEEISNDRVGNLSTAITFANRILARRSYEAATITCTVQLPSTHVGLIDAGQRIWVRFSHLTGFQTGAWTRVETKAIVQTDGDPLSYDVTLTLSTKGLARTGGGGDPGDFPHPPATGAMPSLVQHKGAASTVTLDTVPTDGNLIVVWVTGRIAPSSVPQPNAGTWTHIGPQYILNGVSPHVGDLYYRIADGETGTYFTAPLAGVLHVSEWAGGSFGAYVTQDDQGPSTSMTSGGAITPAVANTIVVGNGVDSGFNSVTIAPAAGVTELWDAMFISGVSPNSWVGYKEVVTPVSTTVGGLISSSENFGGVTYTIVPSTTPDPPEPAQPVNGEIVTMDGADGTTAFPYASGSLKVFVDNTDQTAAVTETIPECGDFTLAFIPTPTEQVVVFYQGS